MAAVGQTANVSNSLGGVFELADESLDEPLRELHNALSETADDITNFMTLKIGQSFSLQNTDE